VNVAGTGQQNRLEDEIAELEFELAAIGRRQSEVPHARSCNGR